MSKINLFKTEIVNGICPHCEEDSILVSLVRDYYRCTTCGYDVQQHINGKISYIPVDMGKKIDLALTEPDGKS